MTTTPTPRSLTSEADFIAAEREIAIIKPKREADRAPGDSERMDELSAGINVSPPPTMIACAVKLRLLTDPDLGIDGNPAESESLYQILAFLAGWQSRDEAPAAAPNGEKGTQNVSTLGADAISELDDALIKIQGVADVIFNIGNNDLDNVLAYLSGQLREHREKADDAMARLFGLNEYSVQQDGPGPLVIAAPAAGIERAGDVA